tara:strand:- start:110 stop:1279 length:1170 start_codon:yes stop_codon:yes gene_type:complete
VSLYQFEENNVFYNIMKTHPRCEFIIYSGSIYYNNRESYSGSFTSTILGIPNGNVSLYELNVDRNATTTGLIYPFITKDGSRTTFSTITTSDYNTQFSYGDTLTGSYPMSSSIAREFFTTSTRRRIDALKNTLDYHTRLSRHYEYSSSLGDKASQDINLISIPSIFYGSSIEKGSVDLRFYVTGALVGRLQDENKDGTLIQTGPYGSTESGSVAGVVLYDEGFVLLTGSWTINTDSIDYISDPTDKKSSSWLYFGVGANDSSTGDDTIQSSSYIMSFNGTEKIPTLTMLANAPKGELNFSNNPTFISTSSAPPTTIETGSNVYFQPSQTIKNTVSSSYPDPDASFKKQVFITKVAIYDEDERIIAVASLANPVKKTEEDDYTFKLKLDL